MLRQEGVLREEGCPCEEGGSGEEGGSRKEGACEEGSGEESARKEEVTRCGSLYRTAALGVRKAPGAFFLPAQIWYNTRNGKCERVVREDRGRKRLRSGRRRVSREVGGGRTHRLLRLDLEGPRLVVARASHARARDGLARRS